MCDGIIAGDSSKGVFLCKHADVQLKAAANKGHENCWLFMFLVSSYRLTIQHVSNA